MKNGTVSEKILGRNAHAGTDLAAKVAHNLIDRVADRAGDTERRLRHSARVAERGVKKQLVSAREHGRNAKTSVGQFVYRHPLACLGIALGAGLLLSALTRRNPKADAVEPQETH